MSLFGSMRAKGPVKRLISGGSLSPAEIAEVQRELIAFGPSAIKPLFEALPPGPVNPHAQRVLGELLTDQSLPVFLEVMRSTKLSAADASIAALSAGRSYDVSSLLPLLAESDYPRARLETILIARAPSIAPRVLIQALGDLPKEARGAVSRVLEVRVDASVAPELAQMGESGDPGLRVHALKLLARLDHPAAVDTALRLLQDTQAVVRLEAARCLATRKEKRAIPALCGRLRDENLKVQTAAIEALTAINDASAVAALIEYLKDDSEYVRRAAVEVLNRVVTVEAIKDLVAALRDADWWVRARAADALGTLGGDRVVEAVMGLLDDSDSFVRRYAVEILNMVPDTRAVEPLIRALGDQDWWVRERAIDALAKTADRRATEPLLALLESDSQAVPVTLRALGQIGDPRAVEAVCRHARSEVENVQVAAVEALKALAKTDLPEPALAALMSALKQVDTAIRSMPSMEPRASADPEVGRALAAKVPPATVDGSIAGAAADPEGMAPGSMLGDRYRIVRPMGSGRFGTVCMAEDSLVGGHVALKILSPAIAHDEIMMQRLADELKRVRRIAHPNVIRVHDFIDVDGVRAISMEFMTGLNLEQTLAAQGPIDLTVALSIAKQALGGLGAAHELGIFHCDLKPANLLVGLDRTVKIVDFGQAAAWEDSKPETTRGRTAGTLGFMAPEQIGGGKVDGRADLYSLGCVLYWALRGGDSRSAAAVTVSSPLVQVELPPLATIRRDVPLSVSDWIARAMARDPADRPATAAHMLDDIEGLRRAA